MHIAEQEGIVVAALTHQGMVRKDNQDSYLCRAPSDPVELERFGRLLIVADGLGGHRGGRVASRMAVELIGETYFRGDHPPVYPALLHAIQFANQQIFEASRRNDDLRGMATTCTAAVVRYPMLYLAQVGDSRAYLIRNGTIRQLSTDHTLVEEMVNSGILSHEEARHHPDSHILTRSIGILEGVMVDALEPPIQLQPDDRLLLCSDGLTAYLDDNEIRQVATANEPQRACEILVDTANERGGRDNITVEILHVRVTDRPAAEQMEDTRPLSPDLPAPPSPAPSNVAWAGLFLGVYLVLMAAYLLFFLPL